MMKSSEKTSRVLNGWPLARRDVPPLDLQKPLLFLDGQAVAPERHAALALLLENLEKEEANI